MNGGGPPCAVRRILRALKTLLTLSATNLIIRGGGVFRASMGL